MSASILPPACHKAARIYATVPRAKRERLARVRRIVGSVPTRVLYPPEITDAADPYRSLIPGEVRRAIQMRAQRATVKAKGEPWTRVEQGADLELQAVMVAEYLASKYPGTMDPAHADVLTLAWRKVGLPLP